MIYNLDKTTKQNILAQYKQDALNYRQRKQNEFYIIKVKSIKNENKIKELKVTGEHVMITFDEKKEYKLILAKELKGNEIVDTDDGFYKIYEIGKEIRKNKYMLSVKGGAVLANGIFVSTICSDKEAKIIKPTLEEWEKYQNN